MTVPCQSTLISQRDDVLFLYTFFAACRCYSFFQALSISPYILHISVTYILSVYFIPPLTHSALESFSMNLGYPCGGRFRFCVHFFLVWAVYSLFVCLFVKISHQGQKLYKHQI